MGHRGSCFDLCHRVLPLFSPKSFIVSGLAFRSLVHFEFIFLYAVRKCSNFILLHVAVQFFQCYLLKRLSMPHGIFLSPLSKIRCPQVCKFISTFYLSPLVYISAFVPTPNCLDACSFVVSDFSRGRSGGLICPSL